MPEGTVKFYNYDKGYGFIKPDNNDKDVFVHVTDLKKSDLEDLHEGDRVTFDENEDRKGKGKKAVNIKVI